MLTTTSLAIIGLAIWSLGYLAVGGHLQKVYFKFKPDRNVPATELRDDVDYYPANPATLFGDHWATIAGGAPLAGGATGVMWGFLPAFLYITVGNIFLGSPHDFSTMHISVRRQGKSIGVIISELISKRSGKMGVFLGWGAILAVMAVFLSALSALFAATPEMTIPAISFTVLGSIMGFLIYRFGWSVAKVTILGVVIEFLMIYLGIKYPVVFPHWVWFAIFSIYPIISASIPAWVLVEPKNYLSFNFLCVGCIVLLIGCIIGNIPIQAPTFLAQSVQGPIWPMLFLTISCGALTGMHAFTTTAYTSRRVSNEKYVRIIGYGGEILEGLTAFIAFAAAAVLPFAVYSENIGKGWIFILQTGYAEIAGKVFTFVPHNVWLIWGGFLGSIFMITTLEGGARMLRIYTLELFEMVTNIKVSPRNAPAKWGAATISVAFCAVLALSGAWFYIWILFPALSSLIALMSFMTVIVWLKLVGRPTGYFWFALLFTTFVVAIPGAGYLTYTYVVKGMYHLAWIPAVAIVLIAIFYVDFLKRIKTITPEEIEAATAEEEGSGESAVLYGQSKTYNA